MFIPCTLPLDNDCEFHSLPKKKKLKFEALTHMNNFRYQFDCKLIDIIPQL